MLLNASLAKRSCSRVRWLRSDLSVAAFCIAEFVRWPRRSRLERSIAPLFEMLRGAVVCPEGAGTNQPGAE